MLSYLWFFITHRTKYDAVVFNRVVYPGFFFLNAKKSVLFAYDASISEVFTVPRTRANRVFEYVLRFSQYFLDVVVGVSDDASRWIARYYKIPESKVHTIYPAAGDEYGPLDEELRQRSRIKLMEKYHIASPYILAVARFDPHKNVERTLDAFFELKRGVGASHHLALVGGAHTPEYSRMIEQKIASSPFQGDIHVLSYVASDDMPALYACADVLVYPSLVEGFGLPPVEAMKSGTPVVTSNISCLPEIVQGAALLVDPLDAHAIAAGVGKVLQDTSLRNELIKKGFERASDFSWRTSADALLRLIDSAEQ